MQIEDAELILHKLVAMTNGWDDATVNEYADEFSMLDDPAALKQAVDNVLRSMSGTYRPGLGDIMEAYRVEVKRRMASAAPKSLPPAEERISFEEGLEVARRAYNAECHRLGKVPNESRFLAYVGLSPEARKQARDARREEDERRQRVRSRR